MFQKNVFTDFFAKSDFSKLFEGYGGAPFDLKALLETQRKNAQAVTEANQIAVNNLQVLAGKQTEIISRIVEDNSMIARTLMTEGTPEEKMAKNAEMFQSIYERTIASMQELSDIIGKSGEDAAAILNKRVAASMTEIQSSLEKAQKKAA